MIAPRLGGESRPSPDGPGAPSGVIQLRKPAVLRRKAPPVAAVSYHSVDHLPSISWPIAASPMVSRIRSRGPDSRRCRTAVKRRQREAGLR